MADAMTAVLPLRVAGERQELDRVRRFLLPSFDLLWRQPDQLEFLVIVPPADLLVVKRGLAGATTFPIRILSEDALCPTLAGKSGWHKQQILKLAAAEAVSGPWYLTLDADVILRRPASLQDLFPEGKPVFEQLAARYHWDWWRASSSLLGTSVAFDAATVMMDVTPEILHRDVTMELLAEIGRRNRANDVHTFLFDNRAQGWTEYSLYWLYVLEKGLEHSLYSWNRGRLYEGIWIDEQATDRARVDRLFGPGSMAFFLVLQSNIGLPPDAVERLIDPYIRLRARRPYPMERLRRWAIRAMRRLRPPPGSRC